MRVPTFGDIVDAAQRIDPYVHRTPVFTSRYFNQVVQAEVFFKAENLQKVGAFKARGATNAVLSLSDTDARRGIVTHSSGNHGQAVAYAAGIRSIPAVVVMPDHAPRVKIDAVARYGAEIIFCKQAERESMVETIRAESGAVVIHPFDNPDVIAGQGTVTLEFVDQVEGLDTIVAPIGGGGLLSGASLVGDQWGIEVVGAEPELVDDAYRSLRDGARYGETGQLSVADGLLTGIGELAFEILRSHSRRILTVSETEILEMVGMVAMRMKLVIEPSAATAVAAVKRYRPEFTDRRVGIIISGGNISLDALGGSGG